MTTIIDVPNIDLSGVDKHRMNRVAAMKDNATSWAGAAA
jgi:hypothetical protein